MMKCRTRQILQHESKVVHNRRRPCQQVFIVQPSLSQVPKNLRGSGDSSGEGVHMHTAPRGRVTTVGCAFEPTRRSTNSMKGQNTSVAVPFELDPPYPAAKQKTCLPLPSVNFSSARFLPWLRDGFNEKQFFVTPNSCAVAAALPESVGPHQNVAKSLEPESSRFRSVENRPICHFIAISSNEQKSTKSHGDFYYLECGHRLPATFYQKLTKSHRSPDHKRSCKDLITRSQDHIVALSSPRQGGRRRGEGTPGICIAGRKRTDMI